jgi:hypothetical protein
VCADRNALGEEVLNEQSENNNCSSWGRIMVAESSAVASLSALPRSVFYNEAATLSWTCEKSTSATLSPFGSVTPAEEGSVSTGPLKATTGFELTCVGEDKPARAFITIPVRPAELTMNASPTVVKAGTPTFITWSTRGARDCTVTGPAVLEQGLRGNFSIVVTQESTYTLSCADGASTSVTVKILPVFREE